MSRFELTYKRYGDRSILIEWPQKIDRNILIDVLSFKKSITKSNIKELVYINNAYNSLLITYNSYIENIYNVISVLKSLYSQQSQHLEFKSRCWKIPVCYDAVFGIDLDYVAQHNKCSNDAIIELHSEPEYTVYFNGFLPGFLYMGSLNELLHTPRKSKPRLKVEKGSVAIGGSQTGIYPSNSPGGWNIIGNTPINLFDLSKTNPCFAEPGDLIKFVPVSVEEHIDIMILVESGVYQVENESRYD